MKLEIHESLRIAIPGVYLVMLGAWFAPGIFPKDPGAVLLSGLFVGLFVWPILDPLQKRFFHRTVVAFDFYGKLVCEYRDRYGIDEERGGTTQRIQVFSGTLRNVSRLDARIIEAYKIRNRVGYQKPQELYRVRMEKSFGVLYFGIFAISIVASALVILHETLSLFDGYVSLTGSEWIDAIVLALAATLAASESIRRYRISLRNELLALRGELESIHEVYSKVYGGGLSP